MRSFDLSVGLVVLLSAFGTADAQPIPGRNGIPSYARTWECIPGVVRADGVEGFRLQVDANGPVAAMTLEKPNRYEYVRPPEPWPVTLRDDGVGQDRVAGDFVFTAGPFAFKTDSIRPLPPSYNQGTYDCLPIGAEGVTVFPVGTLKVQESDGAINEFLMNPEVGFLAPGIPVVPVESAATDLQVSRHLVNMRTGDHATQVTLRGFGDLLPDMLDRVYDELPDGFDFLVLLSTNKVRDREGSYGRNGAGVERPRRGHACLRQDIAGCP